MKIQVEIDDFYLEDEDVEQSLKQFIIQSCVNTLTKRNEKKIEDQIFRTVEKMIEKSLLQQTTKKVNEFIEKGTLKFSSYDKEEISIPAYIKKYFETKNGWASPQEQLEKLAKTFGEELKKRYDLLFASQIVAKLSNAGLLKEDAAKMLLETIDKK